ncbi:MAG: DNA damage-inducible protein DinB [Bacteroidetes bacterium]|nr:MAG: DNA damage-inducible protein DinB [Bacteroidota bacterium]
MRSISKPHPGDYSEYASRYIDLLPDDGKIIEHLKNNFEETRRLIYSLPEKALYYRYAPGKWSIKEVLVHIIDDERIYAYRILRFARNDQTGLPGFDQELFNQYADADQRNIDNIFEEYEAVRNATIALLKGLPEDCWERKGQGIGSFTGCTVRALVYHLAGHELYHLNLIKERYLPGIFDI